MNKKYKHIFFDLDNTLWDFDKNSTEALGEIFESENLSEQGFSFSQFAQAYARVNSIMWDMHRSRKIGKEGIRKQRFILTLKQFDVYDNALAERLNEEYTLSAVKKKHLMPFVNETLEYLYPKYKLHIITNGFEESQRAKLSHSGIDKYFINLITCESAACTKPARKIFEYALKTSDAKRNNSLMIGDSFEVDIAGARRVGMDQVFVCPMPFYTREKITFHVQSLAEIKKFL